MASRGSKGLLREVLRSIPPGLVAGVIGSVAISAAELAERRLTGRRHGHISSEFVEKVLDVHPRNAVQRNALDQLVHFSYGAGWGALRAVMDVLGAGGLLGTLLHWAALDAGAAYGLPLFRLVPPPRKRARRGLAADAIEHGIYSLVTAAALKYLNRR